MEPVELGTLNIEQLARRLGVARGVAYKAARNDALPIPVIRIGRRMFVSKAAVEELLRPRPISGDAA